MGNFLFRGGMNVIKDGCKFFATDPPDRWNFIQHPLNLGWS